MGIFEREKYSKENYETAKENAKISFGAARNQGSNTGMHPLESQALYDALWESSDQAEARVKKLHGIAEKEAITLNQEYDHLRKNAQEALEKLAQFEKEKLGMHKELSE